MSKSSKSRMELLHPRLVAELNAAAAKGAKKGAKKAIKERATKLGKFQKNARNGGDITAQELARAITGSGSASDVRLVTRELARANTAAKILNLQKTLERTTDPQKRAALGSELTFQKLRKAAAESQEAAALLAGKYGNRGFLGTDAQAIDRTTGWSASAPGARGGREQLMALQSELAEAKKSQDPLRIDEASQRLTLARLTAAHEAGRI